jgi:hypothetical protein
MARSERQQPLSMTLKLLTFSGFDEVNVSQFASQFVSRILVDGAVGIIGRGILNKIRVADFYSAGCRFESAGIAICSSLACEINDLRPC